MLLFSVEILRAVVAQQLYCVQRLTSTICDAITQLATVVWSRLVYIMMVYFTLPNAFSTSAPLGSWKALSWNSGRIESR